MFKFLDFVSDAVYADLKYDDIFSCRLDYCNSILDNVPMSKSDRLPGLQNQCAHILAESPRREHNTQV